MTYSGQPLTRAALSNATVNGYCNSAVYYLFDPPAGSATLTANMQGVSPQSDVAMDALTLAGVATGSSGQPELNSGWTNANYREGTAATVVTSLSNLNSGSWVVTGMIQRTASDTLATTVTSGVLNNTGPSNPAGQNNNNYWYYNSSNTSMGGALDTNVSSSGLTITGSDASGTDARMSIAAAAFSPTIVSNPVAMGSTAVDVTGASTLKFYAVSSATLGNLTLEPGASLSMTTGPAAGVSFNNITAAGTSQIAAGEPISLTGGQVDVAPATVLTIAAPITAGTLDKTDSGTLILAASNGYAGGTTVNAGGAAVG